MLRDRLPNRVLDVGPLALDHTKRDTVNEKHDVRPPRLMAPTSFHRELLGHMKHVVAVRAVRGGIPVDVLERKALGVTGDRLLKASAQTQQVVNLLIGADKAVKNNVFESLNTAVDVGLRERMLFALEANAVDLSQLSFQDAVEHNPRSPPPAQLQSLLRREVGVPDVLQ